MNQESYKDIRLIWNRGSSSLKEIIRIKFRDVVCQVSHYWHDYGVFLCYLVHTYMTSLLSDCPTSISFLMRHVFTCDMHDFSPSTGHSIRTLRYFLFSN
jgi:hypothetical protein